MTEPLNRRLFANQFRSLCHMCAELTKLKVPLTTEERQALWEAREYLDLTLKNDEYWRHNVA